MGNLAIIPARGGSKRIPKKNIKDFFGKPIIAYVIETALKSQLFDVVMVSTDDLSIADIAKSYGAEVPFLRSSHNANDLTPLTDVVDEVKETYNKQGVEFDFICCILPTSPLLTEELLSDSFDKLKNSNADSIRPIVRFSYPIQRSFKLLGDHVEFMFPEFKSARSQDLELAYHDAGMFYWMKAEKGLNGELRLGFEISEYDCQDIDNEVDWKMAELKYQMTINSRKQ